MEKQKPIDKQRVSDHVAKKVAGYPAFDTLAEMSSNSSLDGIEEIAAQAKNRMEKSDSLRSRVPGAVELLEVEG